MASQRKRFSLFDLKQQLERRDEELKEAREQQGATAEILKSLWHGGTRIGPGEERPVAIDPQSGTRIVV
jgi:hypothetical protein